MGVEREQVVGVLYEGKAMPLTASRGASGGWSVEFDLNFRILIGDGREVIVRKRVTTRATEQRGRRRKA